MTTYSLNVVNNSKEDWDFYMFQKNPQGSLNSPKLSSLAWFTKYAASSSKVQFQWDLSYNLLWSEQGVLVPGVKFQANQSFPADPFATGSASAGKAGRQATLRYDAENDYFRFVDSQTVPGSTAGTLYVACDGTVPNGRASVGIGMSNAGTFAMPALTNITAGFTPEPTYYVAASVSMQVGQVLEDEVSNSVQLEYDEVTSLTATFSANHTWSVTSS
jgi:rhizosphere induced protein